jgi:ATP-dependent RNA helicase DDX35
VIEIEHEMLYNLYHLVIPVLFISDPVPDYVKAAVDTVTLIHEHEPSGDVLAFLTGQEEVDRAVSLLKEQVVNNKDNCKLHFRITRTDI